MITTEQSQIESAFRIAITRYFEAFNANDFGAAAALFSDGGELCPPFESAVVGPEAIAHYLNQEAGQMTAHPDYLSIQDLGDGELCVGGQVDAIAFKVGVEWTFLFTEASEIKSLSIRLKASMKELLTMRST